MKFFGKSFFKKIIFLLIFIILLFFIFILSLEAFLRFKNFQNNQENLKRQNNYLSQQILDLGKKNIELCENMNEIKSYFLLGENQCIETEKKVSIEKELMLLIDVLLINEDEEIIKKIKAMNIKEENKENEKDDFEDLLTIKNLDDYLEEYNIKRENKELLITFYKEENKKIDIFWQKEESKIMVNLLEFNKIIALSGFTELIKDIKHNLNQKDKDNLLKELSNHQEGHTDEKNILLLGKNGGNTDTIILANINISNKKVTLISIPRDLWIDSVKINSFYARFGINFLIEKIEKITNKKISYYVLVDMSAFIEIIDEIGGIDYNFEKPLIDPSYKTDNGTLYFSKGMHHLNGKEALRVARSRNTTSDFHRSARQQKILFYAKNKLEKELSIKNIYKLSNIIMEKIETNITIKSAIDLYWISKNFDFRYDNVISTGNILNSKMTKTGSGKIYILLPEKNDWSLIPKYINKIINN